MNETDSISRKDVIDAVKRLKSELSGMTFTGYMSGKRDAYDIVLCTLNTLPSNQPEIIRCKDCIYQKESWCGIKYCEANGDHIGKDYDYCSNVRRKDNERFY